MARAGLRWAAGRAAGVCERRVYRAWAAVVRPTARKGLDLRIVGARRIRSVLVCHGPRKRRHRPLHSMIDFSRPVLGRPARVGGRTEGDCARSAGTGESIRSHEIMRDGREGEEVRPMMGRTHALTGWCAGLAFAPVVG